MNKNTASWIYIIGIIALVVAPLCLFYMDRELLFPFITGKNFFWRFFITIAFVAWSALALFNTKYRISLTHPFVLALGTFMAIILASNMFGYDPYFSFWSGAERMDGYISLLYLAAYFTAFVGFIKDRVVLDRFIMFLCGVGVLLAITGLTQEKERVDGLLGNPIYLGSLSLFGIFISAYFAVSQEKILGFSKKWRVIGFGALALFFLHTLFETGTRGALVGLVGGGFSAALLVSIFQKDKDLRWWRYISLGVVAIVLISGGLFFGAREQLKTIPLVENNFLLSRIANISLEDNSTIHRLTNWEMAIDGWQEKPLLGWGQENYAPVFSKYYNLEHLWNAEQWFDRTHNTYLDWLVFGGVLGLGSYLALFIIIIFLIWKRTPLTILEKSVVTGLFVAYLFQNLVAFDSLVSGIYLYSWFAFVTVLSQQEKKERIVTTKLLAKRIGIVCLVLFSAWWVWYSIYVPQKSTKAYIDFFVTSRLNTVESAETALPLLQEAFKDKNFISRELVLQTFQRKEGYLVPGSPETQLRTYLSLILESSAWVFDTYNSPTKFKVIYGSFLLDAGAINDAITQIESALSDSPQKATISFLLATAYERGGRVEEGRALLERVVTAVPEYVQAKRILDVYNSRNPQ